MAVLLWCSFLTCTYFFCHTIKDFLRKEELLRFLGFTILVTYLDYFVVQAGRRNGILFKLPSGADLLTTKLKVVTTGKNKPNIVEYFHCGVGLVVECLPSKQETRVRFSYAAQKCKKRDPDGFSLFAFLCGIST